MLHSQQKTKPTALDHQEFPETNCEYSFRFFCLFVTLVVCSLSAVKFNTKADWLSQIVTVVCNIADSPFLQFNAHLQELPGRAPLDFQGDFRGTLDDSLGVLSSRGNLRLKEEMGEKDLYKYGDKVNITRSIISRCMLRQIMETKLSLLPKVLWRERHWKSPTQVKVGLLE